MFLGLIQFKQPLKQFDTIIFLVLQFEQSFPKFRQLVVQLRSFFIEFVFKQFGVLVFIVEFQQPFTELRQFVVKQHPTLQFIVIFRFQCQKFVVTFLLIEQFEKKFIVLVKRAVIERLLFLSKLKQHCIERPKLRSHFVCGLLRVDLFKLFFLKQLECFIRDFRGDRLFDAERTDYDVFELSRNRPSARYNGRNLVRHGQRMCHEALPLRTLLDMHECQPMRLKRL